MCPIRLEMKGIKTQMPRITMPMTTQMNRVMMIMMMMSTPPSMTAVRRRVLQRGIRYMGG